MVKTNTKKQTPISEGAWKDLRVRTNTAKSLGFLKLNLDMNTYDDVIQYLLTKEGSQ